MRDAQGYSDVDLLNDFREGNPKAVEKLFELYYEELVYFVRQLIPDLKDAEDIASGIFIKLLKKQKDFENLSNIKAYLFVTARNAAFDELRKENVHAKYVREAAYIGETSTEFDYELYEVQANLVKVIRDEINALPTQCREIFTRYFVQHKSTQEIATDLHLADVTVRRQKQIALVTIRLALQRKKLMTVNSLLLIFFFFLL
ncbi:sigma-70 family RNA polymerase sigma factor [Pseudoflavitalea sp. G-6-1-2]|uniref:sigma-70 family RNA polymerase sigma factor n=1 Tax=Pseudoflavitalea sp. G-6-1-2 TaxID=2728841 RepID=UPI00146B4CA0|nr:sigma-70 family RNA polymerase sigma factor [Pseudoflavitalea sp. G-6-1-2]NML22999.1 sigma-70 family RNA polymerase sigma factor [Pseudoflavitalea sp. G-6-1-2]